MRWIFLLKITMNEQIAYDKKRNQKIHKHKYSRIALRFKSKQEQKNDPLLFFSVILMWKYWVNINT